MHMQVYEPFSVEFKKMTRCATIFEVKSSRDSVKHRDGASLKTLQKVFSYYFILRVK